MSTPRKNTQELHCHVTKETMERIESIMIEYGCDLGAAVDILADLASQVDELAQRE